MTTETLPQPREAKRVERARFPLVLKIFLLTALLIVVVVGIAIGVTINRANEIAQETVKRSIGNAAHLFNELQQRRLQELALGATSVGRDPNVTAYVQKAAEGSAPVETPAANTAPAPVADASAPSSAESLLSIADLLSEQQSVLKSDLMIFTNSDGVVLARTDQAPGGGVEDLYKTQPLVKAAIESSENDALTGVISLGDRLYHAAVAPLSAGASGARTGFVVNAYAIDEKFANQIAQVTSAEVLFVPAARRKNPHVGVPRSTGAPSLERIDSMGEVNALLASRSALPPSEAKLADGRVIVTGEPLRVGDQTIGGAVFLRSLDRELAPFVAIERTMLGAGTIALILAFLFSWLTAKRLTRPVERLASIAQRVADGDYSESPNIDRSDEIGILSRAFGQMMTSLRDKAELEELYAEMSARAEEREAQGDGKLAAPASEESTVLVTDLRGAGGEGDASTIIQRVADAMGLQEREIERQSGRVREIVGHRLVSTFSGERSVLHALRAARSIAEELASDTTNGQALSVGCGIATGEFVAGGVTLNHETGLAMVGNAPLLALLLAWEAPSAMAYVSLESSGELTPELLAAAQRDEVRLRWLPSPVGLHALPLLSITTSTMPAVTSASLSNQATMRMDGTEGTPRLTIRAELKPGFVFANRYAIEQIVGRGGMGVVYRATDRQLDETVAIKTLPGDALSHSTEELDRFKREIRLARQITHRNVLRTFDYGEADGVYFISMEYVRGYTLSELLEETPKMSIRPALGVMRQISRGLQAAHDEGIVHRDIKPQNVLVDQKGVVKLMDFGIARRSEAKEAMTQAGLIVGTPHYMSPEQVQGKPLDARSDVYSMGVMMYEALCGQRPFDSESLMGVLTAHLQEKPRPAIELRPEIGAPLNTIIMRCLEKDAKKRYADAGELLEALDALQQVTEQRPSLAMSA